MSYLKNSAIIGGLAFLSFSTQTVIAQQGANALEEIVVTGRKREENLIDVPVSISVWNSAALEEQGIVRQDDLFNATVGLDYVNWAGNRNQNNPGVRGVQSDLRATNQQKVSSFIDGTPMQGNQGSLQFSGIDAVEIYRGPQSAAFGRSTFAGAINYVTADSSEEFSGKVQVRVSDIGDREVGLLLSGPITENLGYRVSYVKTEFTGPDNWTSTDGFEMGKEETDLFSAKLNFEFSDTVYGEVSFMRNDADDLHGASWVADPGTCGEGSGIFRNNMGANVELPSGKWDCPSGGAPGGLVPRNHDVLGQFLAQYDANAAFYTAAAMAADANMDGTVSSAEYLAQTFADGQTYEQALIGRSVDDPQINTYRDRFQAELNVEIGDSLLTFLGMVSDEESNFWFDNDNGNTVGAFSVNMMTMLVATAGNLNAMLMVGGIEETYAEVRWVSPSENRLRFTLSGSFYDYDLASQVYNNGGAAVNNLLLPDGSPVNALSGITISEVATNIGASFGIQYDLTDSTTLSLESRYQVDEVCGQDNGAQGAGVEFCQETTSILPRLSINTALNDNTSIYAQASLGNNPAGVNIAYQDPGNIEALAVANGSAVSPFDGFIYDGSDGVHFAQVDYDENTFADFEEEELYNFEIGAKGTFAEGRGAYTAAVYFMIYNNIIGAENLNWSDTEVNGWNEANWTTFTGERTWINQGDGEMFGIELDGSYAVNDIWTVGGYLTLSSAKYTDYCSIQAPQHSDSAGNSILPILTPAADGVNSSCGVVDGNWIPRQKPVTANFNVNATLPNDVLGLRTSFRADVRYNGTFFEDQLNLLERKAVTTVNASVNMRNENWNIRLFVNNLTDVDEPNRVTGGNYWVTGANPAVPPPANGSWVIIPRRPREFGVQVGYQF